ncbi:hypothetical protein LMF32_05475 [Desemzia sp. C1]|uniref:hypothetical protein n=1 Tax=Desemzia TaxID=82800 RepID=UPI001E4CB197|nr:hypothetical protein [Desemzia sp. C1]MCI3028550.1 hypothetical protein [Desemzia sp. C1]
MKKRANQEIRTLMKEKGVYQWEVALKMGVTDVSFSRWLRVPLTEEKRQMVVKAIEKAAIEFS